MTKYAVARMNGRQLRFFSGRYYAHAAPVLLPVTTGRPDKARSYDEEPIATLVCSFLNLFGGAATHGKPWAVMPLPEARK